MKTCLAVVAVVLLCLSCALPGTTTSPATLPKGTIYIRLPTNPDRSKGAIPVDYASTNASYFEAVIYNSTYSTIAVLNGTGISVPVGTYNVVALAGKGKLLLGSGKAEDVVVEQDQRTDVTITLVPPTIDLAAPDSVIAGREFTFTYAGDLNNSLLSICPYAGGRAYYTGEGDSILAVHYLTNSTGTGSQFSFSETLQAPSNPMNLKISIAIVEIYVNGQNSGWSTPDCYYTNLDSVSEVVVSVIEDPTGIGITLSW